MDGEGIARTNLASFNAINVNINITLSAHFGPSFYATMVFLFFLLTCSNDRHLDIYDFCHDFIYSRIFHEIAY